MLSLTKSISSLDFLIFHPLPRLKGITAFMCHTHVLPRLHVLLCSCIGRSFLCRSQVPLPTHSDIYSPVFLQGPAIPQILLQPAQAVGTGTIGWGLMKRRDLFLPVLKTGKLAGVCSSENFLPGSELCPHLGEGVGVLPGSSSARTRIPVTRLHPRDLSTPQRSHLLTPSHCRLGFQPGTPGRGTFSP